MILIVNSDASEVEINLAINEVIKICEYTAVFAEDSATKERIELAITRRRAEVLFQIILSNDFGNYRSNKNISFLDAESCARFFSDFNKSQYDFILNPETCSINAYSGSGKTFALVHSAITAIAKGKCKPDELCFITFTKEATKEINNRFNKVLEAYAQIADTEIMRTALCYNGNQKAFTIDAFFIELLREAGADIGISKNIQIKNDDKDINKIITEVVESEFERERNAKLKSTKKKDSYPLLNTGFYAKDFISFIKSILNQSNFDYYSFRYNTNFKNSTLFDNIKININGMIVADPDLEKLLNQIVKECIVKITAKTEERIITSETIPLKAVHYYLLKCSNKFKDCNFIKKIKYLFIDENQDCSPIQLELIRKVKLANKFCKYIHIGDSNQAIYAFRMGKSSAMQAVSYLPQVKFKYNYRCSKKILDYTNCICTTLRKDFAKKASLREFKNAVDINLITPTTTKDGLVRIVPADYDKFLSNNNGMINVVKSLLEVRRNTINNSNSKAKDDDKIFILVRDNAKANEIYQKLKDDPAIKSLKGSIMIPKYGSLFTSQCANDLLALLKYRQQKTDITNAINLINSGFARFDNEISAEIIINMCQKDKNKIFNIADVIYDAAEKIILKNENVITNIKKIFELLPNKYAGDPGYTANVKLLLNELSFLAKNKTSSFDDVINSINFNASRSEVKTIEERKFEPSPPARILHL